MQEHRVEDIIPFMIGEYVILGDGSERRFTRLCPIFQAEPDSLTWVSPSRKDKQQLVEQTEASIVICDKSINVTESLSNTKCLVVVDDPRVTFVKVGNALFAREMEYGIHPTAVVHPEAEIHQKTYIGPYTCVGKCIIEEGTAIHGHCYLYDDANISIGRNVVIHAGCTIGVDGFGYVRNESGEYENFPQVGGVLIEDNVEIHSHVNIDRGTLGYTIIGKGTKIDKFCHIGHNVVIGEHCVITAHSMLGGSAQIGDNAWIAPCACIRDGGIKIGSHAFVGMAAVVTKDVPENTVVMGMPARPAEEYKRLLKALKEMTR